MPGEGSKRVGILMDPSLSEPTLNDSKVTCEAKSSIPDRGVMVQWKKVSYLLFMLCEKTVSFVITCRSCSCFLHYLDLYLGEKRVSRAGSSSPKSLGDECAFLAPNWSTHFLGHLPFASAANV
ncbi:unnamed protein product [Protopolystoma xenopodis]|uniref:Uncharacterized protein n=1 Tax=Protopolystoma xenopodis TaxID=117903 RepID=A0A3S5BJC2_9PLAT|nr:unnamed protein product [Protopolystoma xenopodis]